MTQPIQTHINAYFADLVEAKKVEAIAHQRVLDLQDAIIARGGELPLDSVETSEAIKEEAVQPGDVSAAEKADDKKGKK